MPSTLHAVRHKLPSWPATHCPSCDAAATGAFCAACSESLHHHLPSAGAYARAFIGRYVARDGKLLQTLKRLLFEPGRLTFNYLKGRRLPYIAPLRLYLALSLVMFALLRWHGADLSGPELNPGAVVAGHMHLVGIDQLGKISGRWATNAQAFMAAPEAQRAIRLNQAFVLTLPYVLIAAMPLFALYLKALYRGTGRVYAAHLIFALHANACAFLLASVMLALPGNGLRVIASGFHDVLRFTSLWDDLQLLPLAWLLAYVPIAMQRVYGGNRLATACKWVVLLAIHLAVVGALTVFVTLIGVVTAA